MDRQAVLDLYNAVHGRELPPDEWSGNVEQCDPGETSSSFKEAILERINYFRTMAGVPPVSLNSEFNRKAQAAALMISAQGELSHHPPETWPCYTADGSEAAGSSNLNSGYPGAATINRYMLDPGEQNFPVGHRRWLLHPYTLQMGTGDIPEIGYTNSVNVLWIFGPSDMNATMRDGYVAWPPPGFVPYQVVYPRWSFSYPDADFTSATVSVWFNGEQVPLTVNPVANGFGFNTIVWEFDPNWAKPHAQPRQDESYNVTIDNVLINLIPKSFTYAITVVAGNSAPNNIHFDTVEASTTASINENMPVDSVVSALTATDPEGDSTIAFSLVAGEGDDDNESFVLEESTLRTNTKLDYETKQFYSVRVQADDGRENGTSAQVLTIQVLDGHDGPATIVLSSNHIDEDDSGMTIVGLLSTIDPVTFDPVSVADGYTFAIDDEAGGDSNMFFAVENSAEGAELRTFASFDYEIASYLTVGVRVTDPQGLSHAELLTIQVNDVNEPPEIVSSVTNVAAIASRVSTNALSFSDPDNGDKTTVRVTDAPGCLVDVQVEGNQIFFTWDPTEADIGVHELDVTVTDRAGLATDYTFQVIVTESEQISYYLPALSN